MKKILFILLLTAPAQAYVNLSGVWFGNGGYKIPLGDQWPLTNCTTCVIGLNWNGTTAKMAGFKNEMIGGELILQGGVSNAINVSVQLSALTGPGSSVISSTAVLCSGVTNYTTRDFEIFVATYVQILGMSELTYTAPPYEERQLPQSYRNPCTVNGNNDCISNLSPNTYATRHLANAFMPDALIPQECIPSSFTVYASSSQTVWIDFYLRKNLTAGVYNGTITVNEGVTVSTTIPIQVTVNNGSMPDVPSHPYVMDVSESDINYRLNGAAHSSNCATAACIATDNAFYQSLWRHRIIPIGDIPDVNTNFFPSTRYQSMLNGSLFTSGNGYQGPGVNTGVPIYMVGTYASWTNNPNWSQVDPNLFSTAVSSWGAYFKTNAPNVRAMVYLQDEPSTTTLSGNVNKWSTWMSTITAAQTPGYTVHSWVTNAWPLVQQYSPYVDNPVTSQGINKLVQTSSWAISAAYYETQGSTQGWAYNGLAPWMGSCYATEDDGMGCWVTSWQEYFKGVQGHFGWQSTNWNNSNQSPVENVLWNVPENPSGAKTFGYDSYPSTSITTGHNGFTYGNGDGVQFYPGTEVSTHTEANIGFLGPVASIRLKYIRRGIEDYDYIKMAYAVNPASTTAIVSSIIGGQAIWDLGCFTQADCSYTYGGRLWAQDPNAWETERQNLAAIILGAPPRAITNMLSGDTTISGSVTFK